MNADENSVATILASYHDALNNSDTEVVIKLYAPDGVFMPQHFPSSVGADAVRKAYNAVFDAITLNAKLVVAEVHQMASGWPSHSPTRPGRSRSMRQVRAGQKPTRNYSFLRKLTTNGKSRVTAFLPPTHSAAEEQQAP